MKAITIASIILLNLFLTISIFQCQTIHQYTTAANSQGDGYIIYLDRHNVYCPDNQVLNGFQIVRPSETTIAVNYSCIEVVPLPIGEMVTSTPSTDTYNNSAEKNYSADRLQYIPVQCPDDMALKGFHLITECNYFGASCVIRFEYTCTPLKVIYCYSSQTPFIDSVNGEFFTLMNVPIVGSPSTALSGFNLAVSYFTRKNTFNGRYFSMKYNYCDLRDIQTEIANYIKSKPVIKPKNLRILEEEMENDSTSQTSMTSNLL